MSQGPLCPNLSQKVQAEVSQMANRNLSRMILLGGLSVNLNHLKRVQGVPQRIQMILLEKEMLEMVVGDHEDIEVKGVGLDHLEGMEQWDRWDLLDQGDSQGEMDYPLLGAHSLPRGWEYPPHSMPT